MRILHASNSSWFNCALSPYATDHKITRGLTRLGHCVHEFSYRDIASHHGLFRQRKYGREKMNRSLRHSIDNFQPDFLLLGHTEMVDAKTIKDLRQLYPRLKVAMWYVDALYKAKNFIDRLPYLDAFFATSAGAPLFDLASHTDAQLSFMPNICDHSLDTFRAFENKCSDIDLLFVGTPTGGERDKIIKELTQDAKDIRFKVYGMSKPSRLYGTAYLQTIGQSSMALNFSRVNDVPLYTSDRQIHYAANGSLVLMPEVPDFRALFSDDEVCYFSDKQDLMAKTRHFIQHTDERKKLAKQGWEKAHRSFNETRVCKYLLEVSMNKPLSEPYEWARFSTLNLT